MKAASRADQRKAAVTNTSAAVWLHPYRTLHSREAQHEPSVKNQSVFAP